MMFTNKRIASIATLSMVVFFGLVIFSRFLEADPTPEFWLGLSIGGGLGLLTCVFLTMNMTPTAQKPKVEPNTQSRWMLIAVIGGLLAARIVINNFPPEIEVVITNSVGAWFIVTMPYLALLAWLKSRSKRSG